MKKIILTLVALFVSINSFAQVNIEKQRLSLEKEGLHLFGDYSVTWLGGNSELISTTISPSAVYKKSEFLSFLLADYNRISESSNSISNNGFLHYRLQYIKNKLYQPEGFLQIEYNKSRLLDSRYLIGSGIRFNYNSFWKTGLAAMLEIEKITNMEEINKIRLSSYMTVNWEKAEVSQFSLTSYIQPDLSNFSDIRFILESEISFSFSDKLSFFTKMNVRYDSEPLSTLSPWDIEFKQGLGIKFGF